MQQVVISGCGFVSPLGNEVADFDAALFAGRSAIRAEALSLPGSDPCQVPLARAAFDESAVRAPSRLPLDRGSAMALAAAQAATAQAELQASGSVDPERLGVYWGCGMGGAATFDNTCRAVYGEHKRIRPSSVVTCMPNAPLAELALRYGAQGVAISYACACASAAVAIGEAMRALREGRLDMAIVGGSEALLSPGVIGAWQAMRVLSPINTAAGIAGESACRPFAADRGGFALGEGAAAFVLERAEHARGRGITSRFALSGFGMSSDAIHITHPDAAGQARAMNAALRDAGLAAAEVGHVNSHGTATTAGDAAEAESLRRVFASAPPAVTANKSVFGHLLGAGGALELVAALRALDHQSAPPTAHVDVIDVAFEIDLVRGAARALPRLRHVMSNSFAFGGTNAVLIASLLG